MVSFLIPFESALGETRVSATPETVKKFLDLGCKVFAEIKAQHPDTVLFFRMGDFYEMFYDDAVLASEVLGITLTSRDKSADEPVPMAGVPWHSVESYLQGMLRAGHKVTLCEQEEELRPGSKILERVVTRVYTPGSLYGLICCSPSLVLKSRKVKTYDRH